MGKASRRKRERQIARRRPEFKRMDLGEANEVCGHIGMSRALRAQCPRCDMAVYLHCRDCEIQVTGCLCSAVERMSPEELGRFRDEIRKKKARAAGLVLPEERN